MIHLDPALIAEIRNVKLPKEVTMWKRRMIWVERDGTKTPIPYLKTSHLEFILLLMQKRWRDEMQAGVWRLSQSIFLLREYEYRIWLDTNPVIT